MEPNSRVERTDIWREGKWLDLWSVVHFLSGVSIALGMSVFKFGFLAETLIVLLVLISYELWEALVQIKETPQNRFMDVVVGMFSFLITTIYITPYLSENSVVLTFVPILILNIATATLGWRASQKAIVFERKVQAEYLEQRTRLLERRTRKRELRLKRRIARRAKRFPQNYNEPFS